MSTAAMNMSSIPDLLVAIARIGRQNPFPPCLRDVEIFRDWHNAKGLKRKLLERRDGSATRREILTRFLLLNAVIDQGPDMIGVRRLVVDVTNQLYRREIRFLHDPVAFFKEVGIAVNAIKTTHDVIAKERAGDWAKLNQSTATKYNLFIDGTKQVLQYAIFRWGMPLAVPLLLIRHLAEKSQNDREKDRLTSTALLDYLETYPSSEEMSQQLKSHEIYGLGKAIGNKAAHLFAKWMVSSHKLARLSDLGWKDFSFEIPFDSNLGRVLWRTGFLLACASQADYVAKNVIQKAGGKGGKHYIRVTNIRGMGITQNIPKNWRTAYQELCVRHLKSHKRLPKKVEIQKLLSSVLFACKTADNYTPAELDDGLMHIGTTYCFNTDTPQCDICAINKLCSAANGAQILIEDFAT